MSGSIYASGEYLDNNPTWHAEESAWKASQILTLLNRHGLRPRTICEVGCGANETLRQLHNRVDYHPNCVGYEISPQALEMAASRSSERLTFRLGHVLEDDDSYELTLLIDVIEHVEDYFSLLRGLRPRSDHTVSTYRLSSSLCRWCWRPPWRSAANGSAIFTSSPVTLPLACSRGWGTRSRTGCTRPPFYGSPVGHGSSGHLN